MSQITGNLTIIYVKITDYFTIKYASITDDSTITFGWNNVQNFGLRCFLHLFLIFIQPMVTQEWNNVIYSVACLIKWSIKCQVGQLAWHLLLFMQSLTQSAFIEGRLRFKSSLTGSDYQPAVSQTVSELKFNQHFLSVRIRTFDFNSMSRRFYHCDDKTN